MMATERNSRSLGAASHLCAFVLRQDGYTSIRCVSEAEPDSVYCAVHRHGQAPVGRVRPRVTRDLDRDVMPWSAEDRDRFAVLIERLGRQKKG
jgi:hypothetical protein